MVLIKWKCVISDNFLRFLREKLYVLVLLVQDEKHFFRLIGCFHRSKIMGNLFSLTFTLRKYPRFALLFPFQIWDHALSLIQLTAAGKYTRRVIDEKTSEKVNFFSYVKFNAPFHFMSSLHDCLSSHAG